MTLKLKLMAVAVALAASASANAAITNATSGNSELFFTIYDMGLDLASKADDRAYVMDLGSLLVSADGSIQGGRIADWFVSGTQNNGTVNGHERVADKQLLSPNPIFSIAPDANLITFLAASDDKSRLLWNIMAGDSAGSDKTLTTSNQVDGPTFGTANLYRNVQSNMDIYLAHMNPSLPGDTLSALYFGADANISKYGNNVGGGGVGLVNTAGLGESLQFWAVSERSATGLPQIDITRFEVDANTPMVWTLANDGTLTYGAAPVPEPSEYALMLAGLGLIGFMARRRLANRV